MCRLWIVVVINVPCYISLHVTRSLICILLPEILWQILISLICTIKDLNKLFLQLKVWFYTLNTSRVNWNKMSQYPWKPSSILSKSSFLVSVLIWLHWHSCSPNFTTESGLNLRTWLELMPQNKAGPRFIIISGVHSWARVNSIWKNICNILKRCLNSIILDKSICNSWNWRPIFKDITKFLWLNASICCPWLCWFQYVLSIKFLDILI